MKFTKNNYSKSYIYKIVYNNIILLYAASCNINMSKTFFQIKSLINKNTKYKEINDFLRFYNIDVNELQIILVKNFFCNNKNEMNAYYYEFINSYNHTIFNFNNLKNNEIEILNNNLVECH